MPTLGPFIAQISPRHLTEVTLSSDALLRWCCIDLTDHGYVMHVRVVDARIEDLISPDLSTYLTQMVDDAIIRVFDPENHPPNHYYVLAITPNRELIRFRQTDKTPSNFMLGETYSHQGAWLVKQPLSRSASFGLNDREHEQFVSQIEQIDAVSTNTPRSRFILQHQARLQHLSHHTPIEYSDWHLERENLVIQWADTSKATQIGLQQEGFLTEWASLKKESPSRHVYCLMLMAIIGTAELQAAAAHEIDSSMLSDTTALLQKYLLPNNIRRIHERWLGHVSSDLSHFQDTYHQLVALILHEFRLYKTHESHPLISAFDEHSLYRPSFTLEEDQSEDDAFELAASIYQKMNAPYYFVTAELADLRQLELDIHAIIEGRESHWQVKADLMVIDTDPDLDLRLTGLSTQLANTRRNRIRLILSELINEKIPSHLLDTDLATLQSVLNTTDDLVTGLQNEKNRTWKIFLLQYALLDQEPARFIQTTADAARILEILDNPVQIELFFSSKSMNDWIKLIKTAQNFADLFQHISLKPKKQLFIAIRPRLGELIQSDEDLRILAKVMTVKQLKGLLSSTPMIIRSHLLQTPTSLQQLLCLASTVQTEKKILAILKAIPDPHRTRFISTPEKLIELSQRVKPHLLGIFLKSLSPGQWEQLLSIPQIWMLSQNFITEYDRIAMLTRLPKALWRLLLETESASEDAHESSITDDLFSCLLNTARHTVFPQELSDMEWPALKKCMESSSSTYPNIHFFQPLTADKSAMNSSFDMKRKLLISYCENTDSTHTLKCLQFALQINSRHETGPENKRMRVD